MRDAMRGDRARTRHHAPVEDRADGDRAAAPQVGAKIVVDVQHLPQRARATALIKNLEAAALAALRKLQTRSTRTDVGRIRLAAPIPTWPPGCSTTSGTTSSQIERRHDLQASTSSHDPVACCGTRPSWRSFPREDDGVPTARTVPRPRAARRFQRPLRRLPRRFLSRPKPQREAKPTAEPEAKEEPDAESATAEAESAAPVPEAEPRKRQAPAAAQVRETDKTEATRSRRRRRPIGTLCCARRRSIQHP